jgi:serine/threonine-protein kinase
VAGPDSIGLVHPLSELAEMLLNDESRPAEAIPYFQRAIAIRRKELGDKVSGLSTDLALLGSAYAGINRYDEALATFAEGERALPDGDEPALNYYLSRRLEFEQAAERWPQAEADARRAFALSRKLYGDHSPYPWQMAAYLGYALSSQGQHQEAEKVLLEARAQMRLATGPDAYDNALPASMLGVERLLSGHAQEALEPLRNALNLTETVLDNTTPQWATNALNLAEALLEVGTADALAEAKPLIDQSLKVFESGTDPVFLAKSLLDRGLLRLATDDEAGGRADLARAETLFKDNGGNYVLDLARIRKALKPHEKTRR